MSIIQEPNKPPHLKLPNFEPLPPTSWWNRLINNILRPFFYLFFTLITSIIIIPVYTMFENLKKHNRAKRGDTPQGSRSAYTINGQPVERGDGRVQNFLTDYGNNRNTEGGKRHHHHHHHDHQKAT